MFMNKTRSIKYALDGKTLYVGFNPKISGGWNIPGASESLFKIKFDPKLGPVSGLFYDLMLALADKLRFKIQWVYVPTKASGVSNILWTPSVYEHVDLTATTTISDIPPLRAAGFDFTNHILEQQCSLISIQSTSSPSKFWNFAVPFTNPLWMLVIFTMVFAAILLKLFNPETSEDHIYFDLFRCVNTFSGDKVEDSDNVASMIVSIVLNFIVFLFSAAYTANLTAVLITNTDVTALPVQSFQEADDKRLTICTSHPSSVSSAIMPLFPNINWIASSPIVSQDVFNGRCVALAACTIDSMNGAKRKLINPTCNLAVTDDKVLNIPWGLVTAPSPNTRCTDFLRDVLSFGITQLKQDGTTNRLLEKSIGIETNLICPAPPPVSLALSPSDLAGVWIGYCAVIGIALVLHYIKTCCIKPYIIPRVADGSTSTKDLAAVIKQKLLRQSAGSGGESPVRDDSPPCPAESQFSFGPENRAE